MTAVFNTVGVPILSFAMVLLVTRLDQVWAAFLILFLTGLAITLASLDWKTRRHRKDYRAGLIELALDIILGALLIYWLLLRFHIL